MAWKQLQSWIFNPPGAAYGKNNVTAILQYDEDSVSLTSVDIRFKFSMQKGLGSYDYYDTFYILFNPESSDRELYWLKGTYTGSSNTGDKKWPYIGETYTLKKGALDTSFTLPYFWFGNSGTYHGKDIANQIYNLVTGSSYWKSYKMNVGESTYSLDSTQSVATKGSKPTLTVTDKKNNTCVISGTLGANGRSNPINAATLYYTTDGTDPASSSTRTTVKLTATSGGSYSKTLNITKACTVKAYIVCNFKYNSTNLTASSKILYYAKPKVPGKPVLKYNKSRLTIRESWRFEWTAAIKANDSSPVKGYYIMLLRCPAGSTTFDFVREITSSNSSNTIGIAPGSNANASTNYFVKRVSLSTVAILDDPATFGFKAGDKVKLRIRAYAENGKGEILQSDIVDSAEYLIRNAGIVKVKVGGTWKEGQVYVKVKGAWEEAETVSTKVNGDWQESE